MTIFHDEVEIEDFEYDDDEEMYYYPCPCGDRFQISKVRASPYCSLQKVGFSADISNYLVIFRKN